MVAVQRVEYDSQGKLCPPRPELLKLRREVNGKFTAQAGHWHRHTIATEGQKAFDRALSAAKQSLASSRAEVFEIDRISPTAVDIYYLMEDRAHSQKVARRAIQGQCPPELSLSELNPTC